MVEACSTWCYVKIRTGVCLAQPCFHAGLFCFGKIPGLRCIRATHLRWFSSTSYILPEEWAINSVEKAIWDGGEGWIVPLRAVALLRSSTSSRTACSARTTEAFASDLQSDPFGHSGTSPQSLRCLNWCRHEESNPGPTDYKSVALPTELYRPWQRSGAYLNDRPGAMQPLNTHFF